MKNTSRETPLPIQSDIPPRGRRWRARAAREREQGSREQTHWYWRPVGGLWRDFKQQIMAAAEDYVWDENEDDTKRRWRLRLRDLDCW
jgi:hypothetical protein